MPALASHARTRDATGVGAARSTAAGSDSAVATTGGDSGGDSTVGVIVGVSAGAGGGWGNSPSTGRANPHSPLPVFGRPLGTTLADLFYEQSELPTCGRRGIRRPSSASAAGDPTTGFYIAGIRADGLHSAAPTRGRTART